MHEKVKSFLYKKEEEDNKAKNKHLIELGLYEKVYSPDNKYNSEYYMAEWDAKERKNKHYKPVAVEVSAEEYRIIKKYCEKTNIKNPVAAGLKVVATTTFILGMLGSSALFSYGIIPGLICLVSSIISGIIFLGFAEVISLLHDIRNKQNNS